MIEDPRLANDFELFLINYKSKTDKFILPYDMYSECNIMNIISPTINYSVTYKCLYIFESINLKSLES